MLWATIKKDSQLLMRDRGTLLSLFLLPLIFVAVFGSLFGHGIDDEARARPLAVYHRDADPESRTTLARMDASGLFELRPMDSPEAVRTWVAGESSRVGLILADGFDDQSAAELVVDTATDMRFRAPIEAAIRGLLETPAAMAPARPERLIVSPPPGVSSPQVMPSGFQLAVPGNAVLFGFFLSLTMALSFVEEKRTGTWRRLLAAPVSRPVLLIAKIVPYYGIGLVQMLFLFGLGALAFDMKVAGSLPALILLTMLVVLAAVALGLLIASMGGTEKQVGSVGSIALLIMGLLGGAMVPRISMPESMQTLGLAIPHAWALDGYYDVLVRPGAGFALIWPSLLAMLGFALVFFVVGALRFRFDATP